MSIDRREFLKRGGLTVAAGLGAAALGSVMARGLEASGSKSAIVAEKVPGSVVDPKNRWGMLIDVKAFRNEKHRLKCVEACHSVHNVPTIDYKKHEIKWIWGTGFENAFPSKSHQFITRSEEETPVMVLCNHCENPPCVRVCPTQATFKRPDGIIMMDYHRCIGCRFCMAGCPYGSRSFNWRDPRPFIKIPVSSEFPARSVNPEFPTRERGVVEKCNFCAERLAKDLEPACVVVSRGAMVFGDLNDPKSDIRKVLAKKHTIQRKAEIGTNPSVFYIM